MSNRPEDSDFAQMRLKTRPGEFKPIYFAAFLFLAAVCFLSAGSTLYSQAQGVYEAHYTYDAGSEYACSISSNNVGKTCQVSFTITQALPGPLYLYYELSNFYQNHQRYYQSRSIAQLQGSNLDSSSVSLDCNPLYKNGSLLLNPCGLIANSFFTDTFTLDTNASTPADTFSLDEKGISLYSDRDALYNQVDGFKYTVVTNTSLLSCAEAGLHEGCREYTDSGGTSYLYYYPDDDTVQYLHESYPDQISPIDGVTDEHFIVWMRVAMMPTFRKLYGKIDHSFDAGDVLVFNVTANYEVDSYDATKTLVLSELGSYGGKNSFLGEAYTTVGVLFLLLSVAMGVR
eukprot:CAMPEP_0173363024 /NCGR_PEP_ID=MMETSP1144-20121109/22151_1 /TAXON_ID=483371 /ORGANISM="non described non described, Strain CCMP2298" /LENGTH=342 /DNA_ID=CAMNT_0014312919 /DNA_START=48 /DNA_END=1073 /DNA_ORIENTATION=+